ncbi:MAG: spore germination protein [Syntrophomonadaceae bacterium]
MRKIPKKLMPAETVKDQENLSIPDIILPPGLADKQAMLKPHIEKNVDIINHTFYLQGNPSLKAAAVYINGIIDVDILNQDILSPLMFSTLEDKSNPDIGKASLADRIANTILTVAQTKKTDRLADLVQNLFDGMLILMFDQTGEVLLVNIQKGEYRAITEPVAERGLRGSREGFIENLDVNISMIRRLLRDPKLVVKKSIVGKRSRTQIAIIYIEDIADPQIVAEVETRINNLNVDAVMGSGMLEQLIEPSPWFYKLRNTEKPDKAIMQLLEGRVLLIEQGTPTALTLPTLFVEFFQSPGDYLETPLISSFIRLLRYIAFFLSISSSALYIAFISFQPELIPSELLVPLAQSRNEVPFPAVIEVLVMELIMQLVIEAGLHLPGFVGQTVGVVGGIIMGQAAINAKLASPAAIIVVAFTTMCTFTLSSPGLALITRILRLPIMVLAATFGIFGFALGWLIIITHLISLKSMGVPFLAPLAPTRYPDLKDAIFRIPLAKMKKRPFSIPSQDKIRQDNKREG